MTSDYTVTTFCLIQSLSLFSFFNFQNKLQQISRSVLFCFLRIWLLQICLQYQTSQMVTGVRSKQKDHSDLSEDTALTLGSPAPTSPIPLCPDHSQLGHCLGAWQYCTRKGHAKHQMLQSVSWGSGKTKDLQFQHNCACSHGFI